MLARLQAGWVNVNIVNIVVVQDVHVLGRDVIEVQHVRGGLFGPRHVKHGLDGTVVESRAVGVRTQLGHCVIVIVAINPLVNCFHGKKGVIKSCMASSIMIDAVK
eukprot:3009008-Rhodomonas_salina.2